MAAKATGYHGGGEKWAEFKIYLEKDWLGDCDAECKRNRRIKMAPKSLAWATGKMTNITNASKTWVSSPSHPSLAFLIFVNSISVSYSSETSEPPWSLSWLLCSWLASLWALQMLFATLWVLCLTPSLRTKTSSILQGLSDDTAFLALVNWISCPSYFLVIDDT